MGQKVSPIGLRVGIIRDWDSKWFADKDYADLLHEDISIRNYIYDSMKHAAISRIEIERRAQNARVIVYTAKPGIVIGRRGAGVELLRKNVEKLIKRPVQVNVQEIKNPDLEARLVGENVVEQIQKRISFRRAMKQAVYRSMKSGAEGIKIECGGRLGGAEIARSERVFEGRVPLHTLRADIDYAIVEAYTTYGRIGVKVWINRGEILSKTRRTLPEPKAKGPDRKRKGGFFDRGKRKPVAQKRDRRKDFSEKNKKEDVSEQTKAVKVKEEAVKEVAPESPSEVKE